MRLSRITFFLMLLMGAFSAMQAFPHEPADRAAVVCRPVLFLTDVAAQLGSSMNDSGRVTALRQPWHDNLYRSCERIAERVFIAVAES